MICASLALSRRRSGTLSFEEIQNLLPCLECSGMGPFVFCVRLITTNNTYQNTYKFYKFIFGVLGFWGFGVLGFGVLWF